MKTIDYNNTLKTSIIKEAIKVLKDGGLVVYPTDTCYGLGADALNPRAIDKIIKFKGSRKGKPISIAVASQKMAANYIKTNPTAKNIFQNLLPGPITVVCQGKHKVDPRLESSLGTLGIRIPNHSLAQAIIKDFGRPITATSANTSGKKTPYQINDIIKNISPSKRSLIDLIINAGQLPANPPSVVVDTSLDQPSLLRQGKISFSQLKVQSIVTRSPKDTRQLAEKLFQKYSPLLTGRCLIFALQGELGSGKTQFAKGIGLGLQIKQMIKSPTFNIIHEYPFEINKHPGIYYHLDIWRINQDQEAKKLEWEKMIKPNNVIVIEWVEKAKQILNSLTPKTKTKVIWIKLSHLGKNKRRIKFTD